MSLQCTIRQECPTDPPNIAEVTREAFRDVSLSDQNEHLIIDSLRNSKKLSVSLVAEMKEVLIGHVAFSPVSICDQAAGRVSYHEAFHAKSGGHND